MAFIIRRRKSSKHTDFILKDVMSKLEIKNIPNMVCPIKRLPKHVPITFCLEECILPCKAFIEFEYILRECDDEFCESDSPCEKCLTAISKYKILYQCLRAIKDPNTHEKRIRAYSRLKTDYQKRVALGKEKAKRIREDDDW